MSRPGRRRQKGFWGPNCSAWRLSKCHAPRLPLRRHGVSGGLVGAYVLAGEINLGMP